MAKNEDSPSALVDVPLLQDKAFWGMTVAQFLGAFNDNLFKQLMLLLAVPIVASSISENAGESSAKAVGGDQQGLATMIFSVPFILFSGFAGYLSDRYRKQTVIQTAKYAEIGIMTLGLLGFLFYQNTGYSGLLAVLFLMGTHSAFFGPGKYGILPELFHKKDLSRANGIILMTTFLAIILGTASAGFLGDMADSVAGKPQPEKLWVGSVICIGIAVLGVISAHFIRSSPAANPELRFSPASLAIPKETMALLARDRKLLLALLSSCLFWLICGLTMQTINSLGLTQLHVEKKETSLLAGVISIGIAIGAVAAGKLGSGKGAPRTVTIGAWGIVVSLIILSLSRPGGQHLLGYYGTMPALIALGSFAGLFAIPVQVFIQTRPPENQKGQAIATMNFSNFIAIFLSGAIYWLFNWIVTKANWPASTIFFFSSLLVLPVAVLYKLPTPEESGSKD